MVYDVKYKTQGFGQEKELNHAIMYYARKTCCVNAFNIIYFFAIKPYTNANIYNIKT